MRKTWTLGATGAALAAVLAAGGCYDFDDAQERCVREGRCGDEGVGPDSGTDAGCTPIPDTVDLPDDAFADTDCDGVDGQADAGFFIDPVTGDDEAGAGTRERPLRTLGRALDILREADAGPTRLYLAGGAYDEAGLVLDVPASLHGGYAGSTGGWRREAPNLAHVDGGTVGLTVRNLPDSGLVVEYVHVHAADNVLPGEPSIALRVVGSSEVSLRHVILEAGRGGDGTSGTQGATGAFGMDGGIGGDGGVGNADEGPPGAAGLLTCPGGISVNGGVGMRGRGSGLAGLDGRPGQPPDAGGGAAGFGGLPKPVFCDPPNCICNADAGTNGGEGLAGDGGAPGHAGAGPGFILGDVWVADAGGGTGERGRPGAGGGSGGSGGSCSDTNAGVAAGGGSGGGGSGGCGGEGGGGGGAGGASIALLLVDSQVTVELASELRTRGGGTGGEGAPGGGGGQGGKGAAGGMGGVREDFDGDGNRVTTRGGPGGSGGNGGSGGTGGPGGGGGGGPSVGVWCAPGAGVARPDDGGVTFTLGGGGQGGGGPGPRGDNGLRQNEVGCGDTP